MKSFSIKILSIISNPEQSIDILNYDDELFIDNPLLSTHNISNKISIHATHYLYHVLQLPNQIIGLLILERQFLMGFDNPSLQLYVGCFNILYLLFEFSIKFLKQRSLSSQVSIGLLQILQFFEIDLMIVEILVDFVLLIFDYLLQSISS